MSHEHHHHGDETDAPHSHAIPKGKKLFYALALSAGYMLVEAIGGLVSHSLALLADAGHMLSDVASLALAGGAMWLASRPAPLRRTFGYRRAEVLAAGLNALGLLLIAVLISVEAIGRLSAPRSIDGAISMAVAFGGLIVNLVSLRLLGGHQHDDINIRGAWLHVVADTLGSVGALLSGAAVLLFGWLWADAVSSLFIALMVAVSAIGLLRSATDVLMESAPKRLDVDMVKQALGDLSGVAEVHDLHIWSLSGKEAFLSAHLVAGEVVEHPGRPQDVSVPIVSRARDLLRDRFAIVNTTIQVEDPSFDCRACPTT